MSDDGVFCVSEEKNEAASSFGGLSWLLLVSFLANNGGGGRGANGLGLRRVPGRSVWHLFVTRFFLLWFGELSYTARKGFGSLETRNDK